jgi:hypothetical protein
MTAVKERILGALTVMSNEDAERVWLIIRNTFDSSLWDDIEEIEPDEADLKMLEEIENNSDCKEFVSEKELYKALGLE